MRTVREELDELRDEIKFISDCLYKSNEIVNEKIKNLEKKYDSLLDYLDYDAEMMIDDEVMDDCDDCDDESQEGSN